MSAKPAYPRDLKMIAGERLAFRLQDFIVGPGFALAKTTACDDCHVRVTTRTLDVFQVDSREVWCCRDCAAARRKRAVGPATDLADICHCGHSRAAHDPSPHRSCRASCSCLSFRSVVR